MSGNQLKNRRQKLMAQNPHCHWCGKEVVEYNVAEWPKGMPHDLATIDHLFDKYDQETRQTAFDKKLPQTVLACYKCNVERANARTKQMSKSFRQKRNELALERIKLGKHTPRPQTFRGLEKLNEWDTI